MPTRCRPCARCACRAAMAALPRKQNPIGMLGVQWCPGGRQMANAARLLPLLPPLLLLLAASASRCRLAATTLSTSASAAPVACRS